MVVILAPHQVEDLKHIAWALRRVFEWGG